MVLVATVAMDHHLHMRPRDDHLLDLRQLWQMARHVSPVHLVLCGHQERGLVPLISEEAGVADPILQIHLKPPLPTAEAGLHLHLVHGRIETLYISPLFGWKEARGLDRRRWCRRWWRWWRWWRERGCRGFARCKRWWRWREGCRGFARRRRWWRWRERQQSWQTRLGWRERFCARF